MSQLQSELQAAVRARDFTGLRESFGKLPPSEIASLICRIHTDDQARPFWKSCPARSRNSCSRS